VQTRVILARLLWIFLENKLSCTLVKLVQGYDGAFQRENHEEGDRVHRLWYEIDSLQASHLSLQPRHVRNIIPRCLVQEKCDQST
jgi:hypothetical protein